MYIYMYIKTDLAEILTGGPSNCLASLSRVLTNSLRIFGACGT